MKCCEMVGRQTRLKVVSFAVGREQLARLAMVAARERRSKSFIVRDALDRELERRDAARGHRA
jgi:predicted transcriptional regulator